MLAGEYSVLQGGPSLAFAVDKRLAATAQSRTQGFRVSTELWDAPFEGDDLAAMEDGILKDTCLWVQKNWDLSAFSLDIKSEMDYPQESAARLLGYPLLGLNFA